jgi:drug/metabolite transporter (DMT)-like permease
MHGRQVVLLTSFAMLAFAGNSLLCRVALKETAIDAASFTTVRIVSGALVLIVLLMMRGTVLRMAGNWSTAFWLFAYAACFSFAYTGLSAGTGALLLFGAVQATMLGYGMRRGERMGRRRLTGMACACAGMIGLVLPGVTAPPLLGTVLMVLSGISWGVFSIRGRGAADPALVMTGSFVRAAPFTMILSTVMWSEASIDPAGLWYAVLSGGVTSGLGYILWYSALPRLTVTSAAIVQLTVPMLAAAGGVVLLSEPLTFRLVLASIAILGGVGLALTEPPRSASRRQQDVARLVTLADDRELSLARFTREHLAPGQVRKLGIVVLTFDGRLYGGGGDLVWIAPVCTIMKYRPESPAPRAPPKSRKGGKPKGSKPGKRPPATPRPGGEAA